MTVSATASQVTYAGNGVTTAFPTTFKFLANSHVLVEQRTGSGSYGTKTEGVHYTLSGAEDDAGGTVTMTVAPPSGDDLRITRNTPITQELDLPPQGEFLPEAHEEELDKGALIDQELDRRLDALEAGATAVTLTASQVTDTFTVSEPAEDTWPRVVACSGTPATVVIGRVENLTTPAEVLTAAVWLDWGTPASGSFTVKYIGGLTPGQQYRVRFEVRA